VESASDPAAGLVVLVSSGGAIGFFFAGFRLTLLFLVALLPEVLFIRRPDQPLPAARQRCAWRFGARQMWQCGHGWFSYTCWNLEQFKAIKQWQAV